MAIFARTSARHHLRRAARQALAIPAFSAPPDCTPSVLGGLWPIELATVTAENATIADYLDADLRRIADSANEKLQAISRAGLAGSARTAAESRVVNVARAFAVLRVESTVRQLRKEAPEFRTEYLSLNPARQAPRQQAPDITQQLPVIEPDHRGAKVAEVTDPGVARLTLLRLRSDPVVVGVSEGSPTEESAEAAPAEETDQRLRRLLEFVARQAPGLRWATGIGEDGDTVLVTDLAHGWIPSGIELPAGVRLLEPGWRDGNTEALLGGAGSAATYAPGDRLGWAIDSGGIECSQSARELPAIDDLGWRLAEATHWRDGLPRMANTLAKAGAAGTGVPDAEMDLLRVHLDTVRYQLLAQYPDVDLGLLLNCLLLAATAGIATGDRVTANYHFAWFQTLSAPAASSFNARSGRRRGRIDAGRTGSTY